MKRLYFVAMACCALSSAAWAQDDYNLFNPVPDDKLRPMTTERPSKTDSVNTVDSGHLELETSLVNGVYNHDCIGDCITTKQWYAGGATTLRLGLTQSSEIQVISDVFHDVVTSDKTAGTRDAHSGFGDTVLRYKYNVIGNNSEEFGLAVIPYVKLPTNQDDLGNDRVEGGLEFPVVWNITDNTSLGGMTQINWLKETNAPGYDNSYVNTVYLSNNFTDQWSGYTEIYTSKVENVPQWQNTLDFGTVYALTDNLHVDTGVNFGISNAADDVSWFAGLAYRF